MRAMIYDGFGDSSVIKLKDVPSPELKLNQIRIRVRASGLNRADIVQRKGLYPSQPGESTIPGLEASGEVSEPGESTFRVGDRVMALLGGGGYGEEICVDAGSVLPLPERYSFTEGAAIMEVFLTAHHNLFYLGGVAAGNCALIHAGGSGVGTAGIQLLNDSGVKTFVTVSSPAKAAACERLGATAIDYKSESFAQVILAATDQKGVNVILDPVGGSYLEANLKCLAIKGRLILIGLMGGAEINFNLRPLMQKRAQLIGSMLRILPLEEKREIVGRFKSAFYGKLAAGEIKPIVDSVYPATQAADAQRHMEENRNIGKIVLEW